MNEPFMNHFVLGFESGMNHMNDMNHFSDFEPLSCVRVACAGARIVRKFPRMVHMVHVGSKMVHGWFINGSYFWLNGSWGGRFGLEG